MKKGERNDRQERKSRREEEEEEKREGTEEEGERRLKIQVGEKEDLAGERRKTHRRC